LKTNDSGFAKEILGSDFNVASGDVSNVFAASVGRGLFSDLWLRDAEGIEGGVAFSGAGCIIDLAKGEREGRFET
jgi:hypothetical protein